MPILKREPDANPEEIFGLSSEDFPWWVAHVRSRQEKLLVRHLAPLGVPSFLPQHERRVHRAGRTFVSYLPLFPGYVFLRGRREERVRALRSQLLVQVIEVPDQELLAFELAQIRRLQEAGASLSPCSFLAPGDVVRVTEGPFEGYKGVVVQEKGTMRLVVSVSLLRKAVAVEFDREVLAPVHRYPDARSATRAIA
jgi:transcriptional antiterminator NusG